MFWVVVLWFLCALCVINGRGLRGDVEPLGIAGVNNVGWVRGFLRHLEEGENIKRRIQRVRRKETICKSKGTRRAGE